VSKIQSDASSINKSKYLTHGNQSDASSVREREDVEKSNNMISRYLAETSFEDDTKRSPIKSNKEQSSLTPQKMPSMTANCSSKKDLPQAEPLDRK